MSIGFLPDRGSANALEVRLAGDTVWLSLNQMVELFQRDKSVTSRHLRNIFNEGELQSEDANLATTASDNKTYQVDFYNLEAIIAVGYRVKSHRGTQFRRWATERLQYGQWNQLRVCSTNDFCYESKRSKPSVDHAGCCP